VSFDGHVCLAVVCFSFLCVALELAASVASSFWGLLMCEVVALGEFDGGAAVVHAASRMLQNDT
jgi:hypothetical protein